MTEQIIYVENEQSLQHACEEFVKEPVITVDTEFMREKTYWSELCLIQISTGKAHYCIDPKPLENALQPLFDVMQNPSVLKVFHASRQDLEIFYHLSGKVPTPVFDTQIAAQVLGFGESVGYQALVDGLLGIKVPKDMRYTDWAQRPLTEEQIKYAVNDVSYLFLIYPKIKDLLQKSGRESWISEEMEELKDVSLYAPNPDEMWQKIKIKTRDIKKYRRLQLLASWREKVAQKMNRPRRQIVRDEILAEAALFAPKTPEEFSALRNVSTSFAKGNFAKSMMEVLKNTDAFDETPFRQYFSQDRKVKHTDLLDALKFLLSIVADKEDIIPKLLCSHDELERLADGDYEGLSVLKGWRFEIFGKTALAFLNGQVMLSVNPETHHLQLHA